MNMNRADELALKALRKRGSKVFQVQWLHNGNWRMELDHKGDFPTREEAEEATRSPHYKNSTTRIVEVER